MNNLPKYSKRRKGTNEKIFESEKENHLKGKYYQNPTSCTSMFQNNLNDDINIKDFNLNNENDKQLNNKKNTNDQNAFYLAINSISF